MHRNREADLRLCFPYAKSGFDLICLIFIIFKAFKPPVSGRFSDKTGSLLIGIFVKAHFDRGSLSFFIKLFALFAVSGLAAETWRTIRRGNAKSSAPGARARQQSTANIHH